MNNHNFISSKILKNKNNKKIIVSDKKEFLGLLFMIFPDLIMMKLQK